MAHTRTGGKRRDASGSAECRSAGPDPLSISVTAIHSDSASRSAAPSTAVYKPVLLRDPPVPAAFQHIPKRFRFPARPGPLSSIHPSAPQPRPRHGPQQASFLQAPFFLVPEEFYPRQQGSRSGIHTSTSLRNAKLPKSLQKRPHLARTPPALYSPTRRRSRCMSETSKRSTTTPQHKAEAARRNGAYAGGPSPAKASPPLPKTPSNLASTPPPSSPWKNPESTGAPRRPKNEKCQNEPTAPELPCPQPVAPQSPPPQPVREPLRTPAARIGPADRGTACPQKPATGGNSALPSDPNPSYSRSK